MRKYCRSLKMAAKIFRGEKDYAGLINHRLSNLLMVYDNLLPGDDTLAEIQIASVCIAWQMSNPGKQMFYNTAAAESAAIGG